MKFFLLCLALALLSTNNTKAELSTNNTKAEILKLTCHSSDKTIPFNIYLDMNEKKTAFLRKMVALLSITPNNFLIKYPIMHRAYSKSHSEEIDDYLSWKKNINDPKDFDIIIDVDRNTGSYNELWLYRQKYDINKKKIIKANYNGTCLFIRN